MRLDVLIVKKGLCASRTEAQRAIADGRVIVNGKTVTRSAFITDESDELILLGGGSRFVSRGGEKLQAALEHFGISVAGLTALDIGASTGGFTDCLLQNGARCVYALENGSGQLHSSLQERDDVVSMEHTNARYMTKDMFADVISFATMDVSFISQKLILPAVKEVLCDGGILVSLIKPQFEVGRAYIGKGGIVKDNKARDSAVSDVIAFAVSLGFKKCGLMESPIKGGDGNTEYIGYFMKEGENTHE